MLGAQSRDRLRPSDRVPRYPTIPWKPSPDKYHLPQNHSPPCPSNRWSLLNLLYQINDAPKTQLLLWVVSMSWSDASTILFLADRSNSLLEKTLQDAKCCLCLPLPTLGLGE